MYENLANRNLTQGFGTVLVYVNDITGGLFIPLFLAAVWIIPAFIIYNEQQRKFGYGDLPAALSVGGIISSVVAILGRLVDGLVSGEVLTITVVLTILSVIWLFFSKD